MFGKQKQPRHNDDAETSEQFARDLRSKIENNQTTSETSGIRVFEHNDERALDDEEKVILETLRQAHENYMAENT